MWIAKLCSLTLALIFTNTVFSQDVIRNKPCGDSLIKMHVDSVKKLKLAEGFKVVREASLSMESEFEMPVIVPLNQLQWYHIVFVGSFDSRLLEVRMYDWEERQVKYLRSKNDNVVDGNGANSSVIAYDFFPKGNEYHMIKPVQVNKKRKKNVCGYILLLKKLEAGTAN